MGEGAPPRSCTHKRQLGLSHLCWSWHLPGGWRLGLSKHAGLRCPPQCGTALSPGRWALEAPAPFSSLFARSSPPTPVGATGLSASLGSRLWPSPGAGTAGRTYPRTGPAAKASDRTSACHLSVAWPAAERALAGVNACQVPFPEEKELLCVWGSTWPLTAVSQHWPV